MVSFLLTHIVSQVATQATHQLALRPGFGPVRASSLFTLIFIGLTFTLPFAVIPTLHAACLGASFVGMTEPTRLSRKELAFASLIFAFIFQFLIIYLKGFGGALGLSAFVSCLVTYFIFKKGPGIYRGRKKYQS